MPLFDFIQKVYQAPSSSVHVIKVCFKKTGAEVIHYCALSQEKFPRKIELSQESLTGFQKFFLFRVPLSS